MGVSVAIVEHTDSCNIANVHCIQEVIPVVGEQTITHVDRIAVLRVAAAFCRTRAILTSC